MYSVNNNKRIVTEVSAITPYGPRFQHSPYVSSLYPDLLLQVHHSCFLSVVLHSFFHLGCDYSICAFLVRGI